MITATSTGSSRSAGCCSLQGLLALLPSAIGAKSSWPSMAETVIGRYKTKLIHLRGSWRSLAAVEPATLALGLLLKAAASAPGLRRCCSPGVDWFNLRRLPEPIGNVPPADAEAAVYADRRETVRAA
jgi:hypothetical protein